MNCRASCSRDFPHSPHLPFPAEEDSLIEPEIQRTLENGLIHESHLCTTVLDSCTLAKIQREVSLVALDQACPSLLFFCLAKLSVISQSALQEVYTKDLIDGTGNEIQHHLQRFNLSMDSWVSSLPSCYQFMTINSSSWKINYACLDQKTFSIYRERVHLAMTYFSAKIKLYRPFQTLKDLVPRGKSSTSSEENEAARAEVNIEIATGSFQAACFLMSIFPEKVSLAWLANVTPWYSVLHFLMQAVTVLFLELSHFSQNLSNTEHQQVIGHMYGGGSVTAVLLLQETDLNTALALAKAGMMWIHTMTVVNPAAQQAFLLCDNILRRISSALNVNLKDWQSRDFSHGGGRQDREFQ
jgi:hypothetical protein